MRYPILIILGSIFFPFTIFASKVEIIKNSKGYQLLKDGKPYYINGAGGTENLDKLKEYGGNSIRTWGVDAQTNNILSKAQKNNISVCFGIWIFGLLGKIEKSNMTTYFCLPEFQPPPK